jgi:hypothetical protein
VNRKSLVVCSEPVVTSTTFALTPTCYGKMQIRRTQGCLTRDRRDIRQWWDNPDLRLCEEFEMSNWEWSR